MKTLLFLLFKALFFSFCLKTHAMVLDWSGQYQTELFVIQNTDFLTHSKNLIHNLHLKPEVVAYEGVYVRSWWHFMTPPPPFDEKNTRGSWLFW